MTLEQLAKKCGLSSGRAANWTESGLILPLPGRRREFGDDQVERVLVIRALQDKGVELAMLAGRNLTFPNSERFVIFDGRELCVCPDAEAAISIVARARRACIGVDLAAIRRAAA
jgi:MerR HTH family regulatory protein